MSTKFQQRFLTAAAICAMVFLFLGGESAAGTVKLRIAAQPSDGHAWMLGLRMLEKDIKERSGGGMQVTLFPSGSLGGERETIEAVIMGSIDMTMVAVDGVLPSWVPETQIMSIPYLFTDRDKTYEVVDTFLQDLIREPLAKHNMINLGFPELGWRHFTNSKAKVEKADDMKGLLIRVQEAPIWFSLLSSFGATPMPIPFPELYTAMQQGVIDGQENPLSTIATQKFYEVQDYLVLDGHTYCAGALLMNKKKFEALSDEHRTLLVDCMNDMVKKQRALIQSMDEEYIATCEKNGMTVVRNPDIASFVAATENITSRLEIQKLFDVTLVDKVRELMK